MGTKSDPLAAYKNRRTHRQPSAKIITSLEIDENIPATEQDQHQYVTALMTARPELDRVVLFTDRGVSVYDCGEYSPLENEL